MNALAPASATVDDEHGRHFIVGNVAINKSCILDDDDNDDDDDDGGDSNDIDDVAVVVVVVDDSLQPRQLEQQLAS